MRELEKGDRNSKSLLANVLDLDGDFILAPGGRPLPVSLSGSSWGIDSTCGSKPSPMGPGPGFGSLVEKELHNILTEIRVISDKIRAEVSNISQ